MKRAPAIAPRESTRMAFSLVEVMIASLVLILVLVSSITALQSGFKIVDNARMAVLADQAIESQIENLRLLNWSYVGGSPSPSTWYFQSKEFTGPLGSQTQPIKFHGQLNTILGNVASSQLARIKTFTLSVTPSVDPTTNATRTDMVRLKIVIRWDGLNGNRFEREFETLYAKAGISDYYFSSGGE